MIVVWCFYRLLPNVRQRWFEAVPGAVFAVAAWLASAALYSLYLRNIANYTVPYGSLGGIIGALMFFFLTAMIFISGADLNHVLMTRKDSAPDSGSEQDR